jgi:hypothetical protein
MVDIMFELLPDIEQPALNLVEPCEESPFARMGPDVFVRHCITVVGEAAHVSGGSLKDREIRQVLGLFVRTLMGIDNGEVPKPNRNSDYLIERWSDTVDEIRRRANIQEEVLES